MFDSRSPLVGFPADLPDHIGFEIVALAMRADAGNRVPSYLASYVGDNGIRKLVLWRPERTPERAGFADGQPHPPVPASSGRS